MQKGAKNFNQMCQKYSIAHLWQNQFVFAKNCNAHVHGDAKTKAILPLPPTLVTRSKI